MGSLYEDEGSWLYGQVAKSMQCTNALTRLCTNVDTYFLQHDHSVQTSPSVQPHTGGAQDAKANETQTPNLAVAASGYLIFSACVCSSQAALSIRTSTGHPRAAISWIRSTKSSVTFFASPLIRS